MLSTWGLAGLYFEDTIQNELQLEELVAQWLGRWTREREVWGSIPQLVMSKNLEQVSHPTLLLATQQ
jgi:hypothetical protein